MTDFVVMHFLVPNFAAAGPVEDVAERSDQDKIKPQLLKLKFAANDAVELVGELLLDVLDGPNHEDVEDLEDIDLGSDNGSSDESMVCLRTLMTSLCLVMVIKVF